MNQKKDNFYKLKGKITKGTKNYEWLNLYVCTKE